MASKLTKEDIQVIATEISKQLNVSASERVCKNNGARVRSAIIEKTKHKAINHKKIRECVATIGLFLVWLTVFMVVLHKISPYL